MLMSIPGRGSASYIILWVGEERLYMCIDTNIISKIVINSKQKNERKTVCFLKVFMV